MKLLKNRIISLALAFVFCIGASLLPANKTVLAAGNANDYIVRVGMYADTTTDSRLFSALTQSSKGFEIGYSSGDRFIPLLPLSYKDIIILPNVNANIDENGTITAGEGNIGAYSTILGNYSSYSKAMTKAKSLGGFVAVVDGGFQVRINPRNDAGKHPNGATAMPTENGITVTDTKGNVILVWADEKRNFALQGKQGARVSFPMLHRSGAVNTYDYMGFFEYSVQDGKLFMVNCLGLEDYTKCVMANEIGTNVSKETRKAFSVLARTVPLGKKHKKSGFDVCSHSACCQVYKGLHQMSDENNAIVDSTKGQYCAYDGSAISVLYHNSNGGASCSSVAAWGGEEVPYLTTVFLDEEGESDLWERSFTKEEFHKYLTVRDTFKPLTGDALSMQIVEKDPYGSDYITVLSVSDNYGNVVELRTSEDIRYYCGFKSANFNLSYTADITVLTADGMETKTVSGVMTAEGYKEFNGFNDEYITADGKVIAPDKVTVKGKGVGHGVGFSAIGSEQLAKDGYNYKYIIGFFFNGTKLLNIK